ncbi:putative ribosomal protein L24e/L24 superfamily [Helianthus annuus]|nr:putative ribosomal protein L24e/L24 superfamily [Helianthus annuus]KAJ0929921.1 putative ribosomal protein L24e/L24 superfamily [Helianthus annuus]
MLDFRIELCRFSGQKIYPGKGIRFIRSNSQVFLFANSKCKRYFHNKLKPSKAYMDRDVPKAAQEGSCARGCEEEASCNQEAVFQAIMGATLEVIQKKRSEKPEVRDAAREREMVLWEYNMFSSIYFSSPSFQNNSKGERDGLDSSMVPFNYLRAS